MSIKRIKRSVKRSLHLNKKERELGRRNQRRGMKNEELVAQKLRERGFRVSRSPGSRTPDLIARKGPRLWVVEVKSTTGVLKPKIPESQLKKLRKKAKELGGHAVIAYVRRSKKDKRKKVVEFRFT